MDHDSWPCPSAPGPCKVRTRVSMLIENSKITIQAVVNSDAIQEEEMNSDGWWNMASV